MYRSHHPRPCDACGIRLPRAAAHRCPICRRPIRDASPITRSTQPSHGLNEREAVKND